MMKGWTLALVLLLTACGSNPQKTYYQLPAMQEAVAPVEKTANGRQLWLEHLSLADYLASAGLVYQTNDVQYVIASNNLWASPLEQQLQQSLVANLSHDMPGWLVTTQPQGSEQSVLNISVTAFHGRYDGKVAIRGEWVLNHHGQLLKQPFNLVLPQSEDGYDALVRTLAQGWRQVAQSIAQQTASTY
ncbi:MULTISPECIES: membrane integrity-associated transporter subunit PqiC [unclassified Brenneria]|uniref:membrane integrity-associated transporter subunit PqiC n=1 Tax=unclassified Brenneria TaxID=2634434 RepID=UPI0015573673|nr:MULTISPECIES: membrane integrity-associated transporter subunit PqiC [unclassified Brenneria]MBJ7220580.1 membrane integrity-associated transporter subunit PqiC [Brenneria sp. L3-3C-1]MEE3641824.1 membrane integrity-associated transporter subunit PqiC [Brenneria sp. L3_3C_1]MEE3649545.1 membrane integrity-associated transporter subunit PqiC [Brenneria sp. HEZEL_4_2_4]NPC99503.1 membrane integrity-associated transporter subunit PqiC [Brenneria sp. hezel4-2-4]